MEEDTLVQMRDALPGIINKTENAIRDVLKYIFGNTTFGLNRYNILTKTGSKYELFYHAYIDDFNADFLRISELVWNHHLNKKVRNTTPNIKEIIFLMDEDMGGDAIKIHRWNEIRFKIDIDTNDDTDTTQEIKMENSLKRYSKTSLQPTYEKACQAVKITSLADKTIILTDDALFSHYKWKLTHLKLKSGRKQLLCKAYESMEVIRNPKEETHHAIHIHQQDETKLKSRWKRIHERHHEQNKTTFQLMLERIYERHSSALVDIQLLATKYSGSQTWIDIDLTHLTGIRNLTYYAHTMTNVLTVLFCYLWYTTQMTLVKIVPLIMSIYSKLSVPNSCTRSYFFTYYV